MSVENTVLGEFRYQGVRCQGFGWMRCKFQGIDFTTAD